MDSTGHTQRSLLDPTLLNQRESQYAIPELHTGALETFDRPTILGPEASPIDFHSLGPLEPQYAIQRFPAHSSVFHDSLTYGDMQMPTTDFSTVGNIQTQEVPTITEDILDRWSYIATIGDTMEWEPDPPPKRKRIHRSFSSSSEMTAQVRKIAACMRCRTQRIRCHTNPENVYGECLTCEQISSKSFFKLPCLRYTVSDSHLSWAAKDPPADVLVLAQDSRSLSRYIAESSTDYVNTFMKAKDSITRAVFSLACGRWAPATESLVQVSLRLWTVTRLTEGNHSNDDTLVENATPVPGAQEAEPMVEDIDTLTCNEVLDKQTQKLVLATGKQLQTLHQQNRPENWLALFITSYVLLHNLEAIIKRERDHARRIRHKRCYSDIEVINGCHISSKTILAYFHYCCKGTDPFSDAKLFENVKTLSVKERAFMDFLAAELRTKREELVAVSNSHEYDQDFWLIGQLFDKRWAPRTTLETALPQTTC